MDGHIREIIKNLNIDDDLKPSLDDFWNLLRNNILKTVFYSSNIEGNKLHMDSAELLLNGNMIGREGRFQDYIELAQHGAVHSKMVELSSKSITTDDVIGLRSTLFGGTLAKYKGLRRYRNGAGYYITCPPQDVEQKLQNTLRIINKRPKSASDALLNALEFHIKFVSLHPFEDGVGRTTRLFMNLYLMKSGLLPIIVDTAENRPYRAGLTYYDFTGHSTPFVSTMLLFSFGKERQQKLIKAVEKLNENDPKSLEIKDTILHLIGKIDDVKLQRDIELLYNKELPESRLGALWLSMTSGCDTKIIGNALSDSDARVRAGALLAAEHANLTKYREKIEDAAVNDENEYNRLLSLAIAAKGGLFTPKFVANVIQKEDSEAVLTGLGKHLTWVPTSHDYLESIIKLVNNESTSIKSKGYEALLKHANYPEIIKYAINNIAIKDPVTQRAIISHLKQPLLSDPYIAKVVSGAAVQDRNISESLLVSLLDGITENNPFMPFLETIIKRDETEKTERAYAIYLIGLQKGSGYLKEKYAIEVGKEGLSFLENLATFLVYVTDLEKDKTLVPDENYLFNLKDEKLNIVESIEINKLMKSNRFGQDFLELCTRRLKQWR